MVAVTIAAVALAFWQQYQQSLVMSELTLRVADLEDNYRKRSRMVSFLTAIDLQDGNDIKALQFSRAFANQFTELTSFDEERLPAKNFLSGHSALTDIDGTDGNLEILSLAKSMKISDMRDVSLHILFCLLYTSDAADE